MNERVEEIRRQHAEHVAEYPRPHFCEDYGCQTVGVLLTALAQAEREHKEQLAALKVTWEAKDADLARVRAALAREHICVMEACCNDAVREALR